MTKDEFKKLKLMVEKSLKITHDNVTDKTISLSTLYANLIQVYSKEVKILKTKFHDKEKIYGDLYHHYKFNFQFQLDTKAEVEAYIKADNKYYTAALEYVDQEIVVKFIEQTLDHINNIGFRIKNYIDLKKMEKGLM